jgi:catechol 2,3-dioxygenase-like lactoylglutathione lyase family enzyme
MDLPPPMRARRKDSTEQHPLRKRVATFQDHALQMIDHISIGVRDLEGMARFYEAVLNTLGYAKLQVQPGTAGFGKRYSEFWLNHRPDMAVSEHDTGLHVALRAASTQAVDEFYQAALRAGGSSDGAPGFRPEYRQGYYAAFIRDPEGNRIEAVTFLPAEA